MNTQNQIIELARLVSNYFGDEPILPFLDGDLKLRNLAREILGLEPIRAWREGDSPEPYDGHKAICPKCGYECRLEALEDAA